MIKERRRDLRFPLIRNMAEPVELQIVHNDKRISVPGFIMNLSAHGMEIVTLGEKPPELSVGIHFVLNLKLPHFTSPNLEGKVVRIEKGEKARLHHLNTEWLLGLKLTKIRSSDSEYINRMAEDWNLCETKIQMNLPDICFRKCAYWDLCEKNVKLKDEVK